MRTASVSIVSRSHSELLPMQFRAGWPRRSTLARRSRLKSSRSGNGGGRILTAGIGRWPDTRDTAWRFPADSLRVPTGVLCQTKILGLACRAP